jgi:type II secretory pathway predicted ATPase ExeA
MYESYFGMKQRPFGATPHVAAYYPATGHEEALATLRYSITQGRGIGVLTGAPGTGKTIVCQRLAAGMGPGFTTAMITNTNMPSTKALLQAILYELSLPYRGIDEQELRLNLCDFLLGKYSGGGRTVMVIDEAQNLAPPVLEELRMLGNLEGEADKLLQIVLAGQPRLISMLRQPEMEALRQRIGARATVTALSDEDTIGYIRHQLQCVGTRPEKIFTLHAMSAVYEATGGVPRLINQLCEHALLLAYVGENAQVDEQIVEQASSDLNRRADAECTAADEMAVTRTESTLSLPIEQDGLLSGSAEEELVLADPCQDSPEIITNDSGDVLPKKGQPIESWMPITTTCLAEEMFEHEEVIVDQYAIMDATRARAAAPGTRTPRQDMPAAVGGARSTTQPATPPRAIQPAARKAAAQLPPDSILFSESLTLPLCVERAAPPPVAATFVGPADQPAVYEVGAGAAKRAIEQPTPAQGDILVIEERTQRIAGNRARIDGPQAATGRATGTYRRLYSFAQRD